VIPNSVAGKQKSFDETKTEIEATLRKLPMPPAEPGRLSPQMLLPDMARELATQRPHRFDPIPWDQTVRKLRVLKRRAKALLPPLPKRTFLPLNIRLLLAQIADMEIPPRPRRDTGAPKKYLAAKVARSTAEFYFALTGNRPTRIIPWQHGSMIGGPFVELLDRIYKILGIDASAKSQAKAAIDHVNKIYPQK
jgi:hypothetical protein